MPPGPALTSQGDGVFSSFMTNTWIVATIIAVIAGVVGFFVVLRGSAFPAHAIPNSAFAGAAAANVFGFNALLGLASFAVASAIGIATLGRRGRHDVVTALALVLGLAIGAVFLSRSGEYEPHLYALLFGEVLGVSTTELAPVAALAVACIAAITVLYRPLLLASTVPDIAEARGVRIHRIELVFLIVLAAATALTVPVVGALLIFSLMIGPPAAARSFTDRPPFAILLSVAIALSTVWAAIASSYQSNWPIGFFVGMISALAYGIGRLWTAWRRARTVRPQTDSSRRPSRPPRSRRRDLSEPAS
jgi:zinc/manganese transport system permease protein